MDRHYFLISIGHEKESSIHWVDIFVNDDVVFLVNTTSDSFTFRWSELPLGIVASSHRRWKWKNEIVPLGFFPNNLYKLKFVSNDSAAKQTIICQKACVH